MPRPRTILHADMDAFYASVEQLDNPEYRGKPVIVGGTGGRGVVSAASYEARAFGVHSAQPTIQARRLCPHGIFLPGRMGRYLEISKQLVEIFGEFTPLVEPLSVDEAFLDITGSLRLFGGARELGERLRQRVRQTTGLPVSVGIGTTKMVAKIASGHCKPNGLLEVPPEGTRDFLDPLPVNLVWGVGEVTRATLEKYGIRTIGELARADVQHLEYILGPSGEALVHLARGLDPREVQPERSRRSYGEEETFDRDQKEGDLLRRTITGQAEAVARRLRADGRRARTVQLKVKFAQRIAPGKYPALTRRITLPEPTDDGRVIREAALHLWGRLAAATAVRLVGVSVSGIEEGGAQMSLFDAKSVERTALNRAVDALADRFGTGVVQNADALGRSQQRARSLGKLPAPK